MQKCLKVSYVVVVLFPPSHHVCRELYRRFGLRRALPLPAFDSDGVDEHVAILIADRSFIAFQREAPAVPLKALSRNNLQAAGTHSGIAGSFLLGAATALGQDMPHRFWSEGLSDRGFK
jgi:hypothetical protein